MADIIHIFRKRSKKGEIKFRPLPLLHEKTIEYPIDQYIMILEQLGYLSKLEEGVFKIEKEFTLPFTSDQAQMMEKDFYDKHKLMMEKGNIQYNQ